MRVKKLNPALLNFLQWYSLNVVTRKVKCIEGFDVQDVGLCMAALAYAKDRAFTVNGRYRLDKALEREFREDGLLSKSAAYPWGFEAYCDAGTRGIRDPRRVQWVLDKLAADKVARDV